MINEQEMLTKIEVLKDKVADLSKKVEGLEDKNTELVFVAMELLNRLNRLTQERQCGVCVDKEMRQVHDGVEV